MTTAVNSYCASYENPSCVYAFVEECMKLGTDSPTHAHA